MLKTVETKQYDNISNLKNVIFNSNVVFSCQ